MKRSLYQILGVDPKASAPDIAAAYERLAAKTDWPDLNTPSLLRQANEILSDPKRRLAYDASLANNARPLREADWDSAPSFFETWGKWIGAIVIVIAFTVGATHRESAPVRKSPPPSAAPRATARASASEPGARAPHH